MAQEPIEDLAPSFPEPKQSLFEGTQFAVHNTENAIGSLPGAGLAGGFNQSLRNSPIWRWVTVPAVKVFITLLVIGALSFVPAFLSTRNNSYFFDTYPYGEDGVVISGYIYRFDWQNPQKVSVSWCVDGQGKYRLPIKGSSPEWCLPPNIAVDVYLNGTSAPVYSFDPADIPDSPKNNEKALLDSSHIFTTEHELDFGSPYYTPLDWYHFSAYVFVIEKATNKSIPVTLFGVVNDGPGDFNLVSQSEKTTNVFTYNNGSGPATVEAQSYITHPAITHSNSARALTFSMLVINWILTLCSMITTSIIFNRRHDVKDGIALLPITIILTVPAVRNLYVGAPAYGIFLDVVGFFPQMLIVVTCTVFVLCGYAAKYASGGSSRVGGVRRHGE